MRVESLPELSDSRKGRTGIPVLISKQAKEISFSFTRSKSGAFTDVDTMEMHVILQQYFMLVFYLLIYTEHMSMLVLREAPKSERITSMIEKAVNQTDVGAGESNLQKVSLVRGYLT